MTADDLRAFAEEIAAEFNAGRIRAPVHLEGGNEEALIEIFGDVKPGDWILGSWRSMSKALLKGVPREEVKAAIMRGRSITLCFPEHRFLTSAIAGGTCPIAVGLGMGIKRRGGTERVWCFVGDMVSLSGGFHECTKYAQVNELPVVFVVEDNGKSVCTDTDETWGPNVGNVVFPNMRFYSYKLPWPHSGAGVRVNF